MYQDNNSDIGNTQLYTRPNREPAEPSAQPGSIPSTVPPPPDANEAKADLKPSSPKTIIPLSVPAAEIGTTVLFTRRAPEEEKPVDNTPSTVLVNPAEGSTKRISIQPLGENETSAHSSTAKPASTPIYPDEATTRVFRKPAETPAAIPATVPTNSAAVLSENTTLISRNPGTHAAIPVTVPINACVTPTVISRNPSKPAAIPVTVPVSACANTTVIRRHSGTPADVPPTVPVNDCANTTVIRRHSDTPADVPPTVPVNACANTTVIRRHSGTPADVPLTVPIRPMESTSAPSGQSDAPEISSGTKTTLITKRAGNTVPIHIDYESKPHTQYANGRAPSDTITVVVDPIPTSQAPHTETTAKPAARERKGGCLLPCLMLVLLLVAGVGLWYYGPVLLAPCISKGYTNGARLLTTIPGLNPNIPGENGQPPLTMAIQAGNMEAVRVLLAAPGIDINRCDMQGHPPIYHAAAQGNTVCLHHLLAMPGIAVPANAVDIAEQNNHKEAAALLRSCKDYAVNALRAQGITPDTYSIALLSAAASGDAARLQLLLTAGATAETLDANGRSALFLAVDKNYVDCVRLLLTAPGTDVNTPNVNNITPLWVSAISGHTECMRLLLTVPEINVNHADEDGETALYWAAQQGHKDCVRMLLAMPGINVNCAASNGATPLKRATANGHRECANMLRAAGAQ